MKKGYLYLVFISLGIVVALGIALVFKLTAKTATDGIKLSSSIIDDNSIELHSLVEEQNYDDSWIQKLSVKKNQKEYIYPVEKFHIEFN